MRRKGDIFIADADTIILSCNGHPVSVRLLHGQEIDLAELKALFPYVPPAEPVAPAEPEEGSVNENITLEAEPTPEPIKIEVEPTPIPEGWKVFENRTGPKGAMRVEFSWCENISTHESLGFSGTRRDKTMNMIVGQSGDVAVARVQKTDMKPSEKKRG